MPKKPKGRNENLEAPMKELKELNKSKAEKPFLKHKKKKSKAKEHDY